MGIRRAVAASLGLVMLLAACSSEVPVHSTGVDPTSTTVTAFLGEVDSASTTVAAPVGEAAVPAAESPSTVVTPAMPRGDDTTVESVVDGDTIVVTGGTRVRLIGVDTPETKDPRKPVQCFGREASAFTESLVAPGTAVRLVYDVERLDRYGRTLAYVHRLSDGMFVNAALVADGYALVATFPPNVAHTEEFIALARAAREEGRGLWSACGGEPATAPPVTVAPPAPAGGSCDASYPGVCIPPAPPDLDCGDVSHRRFDVLPPDPHRFDGEGDGVGCEG